jgi:hypothetical protein
VEKERPPGQWIGKVNKNFNFNLIANFQVIMAWIRLVHRDETMWGQKSRRCVPVAGMYSVEDDYKPIHDISKF